MLAEKDSATTFFQQSANAAVNSNMHMRGRTMPLIAVVAQTPYYVLMDGTRRIGPKVLGFQGGAQRSPVYGFSDKEPYDVFCANSHTALTPYPLVKSYLQDQASGLGEEPTLMIVDADGPKAPILHAATIKAVLEAQENRASYVTVTHQLIFDEQADAYRLDEASVEGRERLQSRHGNEN
jgi:hypothetical protein